MLNRFFKKTLLALLIISATCVTSGCSSVLHEYEKNLFAMDTYMTITIYSDKQTDLLDEAEDLIRNIESDVSVTDENSVIYKLNKDKTAQLTDISENLISSSLKYCADTDGALDISIYPIVKAWGFTTDTQHIPDDETITKLLSSVDYKNIIIDGDRVSIPSDMEIDLGAVTKGYTSDSVITRLKNNGIEHAIISLGGNVQVLGNRPDGNPWKVAIRDPFSQEYAGVVSLVDKAAVTSGDYERFFEENDVKYHHIMDPSTGYPAKSGLSSVTIVSESGIRADALSTSLFVMGLGKATTYWQNHKDFDAIFITTDGEIYITEGLSSDFTPMGDFEKKELHIIK